MNYHAPATELRAATLGGGVPAVGWARIALSIVTARQSGAPRLMVEFADQPPLVIDLDRHDFSWVGLTGDFPERVSVLRVLLHEGPAEPLSGFDLDLLLWAIGLTAFGDERAGWLAPDSRVMLTGWPNLTVLDHTPEHVRMTATLGSTYMTPDELAVSAGVPAGDAQRLINALGLMDLLVAAAIVDTDAPPAPPASRGLFRRLRDRLGL